MLALEILLYLAQKEPKQYREVLASTFHNVAQIYSSQLEYSKAQSAYRESLNRYIKLAEENPSEYGSYVATLFKDIAFFYKKQNKMDLAEYFHLRLVEIYRDLHHYNESAYGLKLAAAIIDGVIYYEQHTLTLYHAEAILRNYNIEEEVIELLDKIYCLRRGCKELS
jgi:hypothetical protein